MITVKLSRANFFKIAVQYWTRRQSDRGDGSRDANSKSLSENSVGSCGEGFWLQPRRRGRSIPSAGCNGRANAGRSQKTRRPEGFRGKGWLASLLLGHSPTAGMLPRRASPSSLFTKTGLHGIFRQALNAQRVEAATKATPSPSSDGGEGLGRGGTLLSLD